MSTQTLNVNVRSTALILDLCQHEEPSVQCGPLSNLEIWEALRDGRLVVKPEPVWDTPPGSPSYFDPSTFVVHLGDTITELPKNGKFDGRKHRTKSFLARHAITKRLQPDEAVCLKPGQRVLWLQREHIHLPNIRKKEWGKKPLLRARLSGRSCWARMFVSIDYADVYHPGDDHQQTLEVKNNNPPPGFRETLLWLIMLALLPGQLLAAVAKNIQRRKHWLASKPRRWLRSVACAFHRQLRRHQYPTGLIIILYPGIRIGQATIEALVGDPEVEGRNGQFRGQGSPCGNGQSQHYRNGRDKEGIPALNDTGVESQETHRGYW